MWGTNRVHQRSTGSARPTLNPIIIRRNTYMYRSTILCIILLPIRTCTIIYVAIIRSYIACLIAKCLSKSGFHLETRYPHSNKLMHSIQSIYKWETVSDTNTHNYHKQSPVEILGKVLMETAGNFSSKYSIRIPLASKCQFFLKTLSTEGSLSVCKNFIRKFYKFNILPTFLTSFDVIKYHSMRGSKANLRTLYGATYMFGAHAKPFNIWSNARSCLGT